MREPDALQAMAEKLLALEGQVKAFAPRTPSTAVSSMVEVDGKLIPGIVYREREASRAAAATANRKKPGPKPGAAKFKADRAKAEASK